MAYTLVSHGTRAESLMRITRKVLKFNSLYVVRDMMRNYKLATKGIPRANWNTAAVYYVEETIN